MHTASLLLSHMLICLAAAASVPIIFCSQDCKLQPHALHQCQLSASSLVVLQPGEDPFGEERKEKKARLASQEGRQLKNKQASDKIHGKPVLPPTLKLAASLPEHGKGVPTKRRELKADVSVSSLLVT